MDLYSKKEIIKSFYFKQNNIEIEENVLDYYCEILKDKDFNYKNLIIWLNNNLLKKKNRKKKSQNQINDNKESKFKNIIESRYYFYFENKIDIKLLDYYYEIVKNSDYSPKDLEKYINEQFLFIIKRKNKKKYNQILENKNDIEKNISKNVKPINLKTIQLKNINNNKNKSTEKKIKKIKKKINNEDKKLFILLPTYNRGQLSTNVIDQILKQTSNKWKLLIINDGSNDEETKILEDYLSLTKSSQIEYIKNEKNIGLPKTLNKGISKFLDSDEDFFTWISDDNFYYNIFVEKLIKSNKSFTYSFWKLNNNVMEKNIMNLQIY